LGFDNDLISGSILHVSGNWLYTGGVVGSAITHDLCPSYFSDHHLSFNINGKDERAEHTITVKNLFDPHLKENFRFDHGVFDLITDGNWLYAALGNNGIEALDITRPNFRYRFDFDDLQENDPEVNSLKRLYESDFGR